MLFKYIFIVGFIGTIPRYVSPVITHPISHETFKAVSVSDGSFYLGDKGTVYHLL